MTDTPKKDKTDADFKRMETDATLTRRYLWACFKQARLIPAVEWLGTISDADLLMACNIGEAAAIRAGKGKV